MARRPPARSARTATPKAGPRGTMVFERQNYILLIIGVVLVVVGYVVMRAENEVNGFLSLYLCPILLLAGYLEIIYAILWRPKARVEEVATANT
ncbi:MAG TPA: DUF3098 domain-containing protein [Rhodothermales bacterium]|nr:DUF3098 domain-containing protein [Rhodothermales bacterium]